MRPGDIWRRAEDDIRSVLIEMNLPYEEAPGEAAFYGPKADFIVRDCIGRQWQLGTVQLDYVLPERFGLEYIGPDNQPHRPVMIHRAPLGSMERFMGILIEHFAGAFPLWLAPEQVRVLPISDKVADYGAARAGQAARAGLPGHASTCAPRRSEPRSAMPSSKRFRPCWLSAPRKPRPRRSRFAIGSMAIWAPCRFRKRSNAWLPNARAGRAGRQRHRRRPLPARMRRKITLTDGPVDRSTVECRGALFEDASPMSTISHHASAVFPSDSTTSARPPSGSNRGPIARR